MSYLDKNRILNSLTKEDVIRVVERLGSKGYREGNSGELIFQTVCHNSRSWKLYYYHEAKGGYPAKIFHCYTRCGDSFNIIELVIRAHRAKGRTITFYNALSYIVQSTDKFFIEESPQKKTSGIVDWSWLNQFASKPEQNQTELKYYSENILELFCYLPHEEFLKDHITAEVMSEFEIGYWSLRDQITIPHRDRFGGLIGIRGRNLDPWEVQNVGKYVPLNIEGNILSHPLGLNLYGIHINQKHIKKRRKVLLLESEKGVMQCHSYFGDNDFSLAVCGSNITQRQIDLLLRVLGVEEIILGFDKEYEDPESFQAEIYKNKLFKKLLQITPYCRTYILWDKENLLEYKDAPTDKGKDTLLRIMEQKILITLDDIKEGLNGENS